MWLFTSSSFLSIVSKDCKPDELLVRARVAGQIEAVFPDAVVTKTFGTDYLFRAVVSRSDVAAAMSNMVMDLDYDNFKNSIRDDKHHTAANGVWGVMARTQATPPYHRPVNSRATPARVPVRRGQSKSIF